MRTGHGKSVHWLLSGYAALQTCLSPGVRGPTQFFRYLMMGDINHYERRSLDAGRTGPFH